MARRKAHLRPQVNKAIKKTGAILDNFVSRVISRKFLVFLIGTYFAYLGMLAGENGFHWIILSAIYIGTETIVDTIVRLKKAHLATGVSLLSSKSKTPQQPSYDLDDETDIPEPTLENASVKNE